MGKKTLLGIVLVIVVVRAGSIEPQGFGTDTGISIRKTDSPAGPGSGEANLFATADGRIHLSWLEPAGDSLVALRFASLSPEGWSPPQTISRGSTWFVNWADFPSLIELPDRSLAAHWLEKSGVGTYAYDVRVAWSRDGGKNWSAPIVPHRDMTKTEHGFVSLLPWSKGRLFAAWLDGRNFANKDPNGEARGGEGAAGNEMTLRCAVLGRDGRIVDETVLDARVCDCCQTSAVRTPKGAIVAYRDRSEKEIRDISIVRFRKGRWSKPVPLSHDGWEIFGCPVNGPALAAEGERVAAAWFTGANGKPQVKVVFSDNEGKTFGRPIRVDDGDPLGRVDIVLFPDGPAWVSWLESRGDRAEIRVRCVWPNGRRNLAAVVTESDAARASGFPQMARAGDAIFFAWTQTGDPPVVRTAVGQVSTQRGTP